MTDNDRILKDQKWIIKLGVFIIALMWGMSIYYFYDGDWAKGILFIMIGCMNLYSNLFLRQKHKELIEDLERHEKVKERFKVKGE